MMKRLGPFFATALWVAFFLLPVRGQLLDHPATANSPMIRLLGREGDVLTLEFAVPDPDAYLSLHGGSDSALYSEGPREGFLLTAPFTALPFPEMLEVDYRSIDDGTPVAETLGEAELGQPSLHGGAIRRLVSQRELGFVRGERLALYQIRPMQRVYEGQSYRRYYYTRARFRLNLGSPPHAEPARPLPADWKAVLSRLVLNPADLERGAGPAEPDLRVPAPRALPDHYLKLATAGEGVFEVSGASILRLASSAQAEDISLSVAGRPWPFLLLDSSGARKSTGLIAPDDRLLFYRAGSTSPFSRYECALLALSGGGAVATRLPARGEGPATDVLMDARRYEEDREFASETEMGVNQDRYWFWQSAATGPGGVSASMEVELDVPGLSTSGTAEARLELWSTALTDLSLRRNLELTWGGFVPEGDPRYDTTPGPAGRLVLTQSLRAADPPAATASLCITLATGPEFYLDRIVLRYPRRLTATAAGDAQSGPEADGWLEWSELPAAGAWLLATSGPGELSAVRLAPEAPQACAPGGCRMALVASSAAPACVTLRARPELPLHGTSLDAVVVSHRALLGALRPWLAHRAREGRRIAVLDVEDFYDVFGDGALSPEAIRRGLAWLYQETQLAGVILCGDASWDYWGRFPEPVPNWVPAYHLTADYPSDLYYATVSGKDPLPDLFLSRLPVQSATDLSAALGKIVDYPAAATGEWAGRFLMLADNSFEDYVERLLGASVPAHVGARVLRFVDFPLTDNFYYPEEMLRLPEFRIEGGKTSPECTRAVIREMDRGNLLVMYYGHGGGNVMGHERYFFGGASPHSDVLKLRDNVPAFFEIYSCWTGWFDFARPKWNIGLGEELLRAPGRGAAGLFLSTGRGLPIHHEVLARHFHRMLFEERGWHVGAQAVGAQILAHAETDSREPVEMFTVFGDFMLRVPAPAAQLTVEVEPAVAPATAERRLHIAGLPPDTTTVVVLAVDAEGQPLSHGDAELAGDGNPGWEALLPACATASPGPLRVAVAAGNLFGGTTAEITPLRSYADKPLITTGSPDLALGRDSVVLVTPDPSDGETVLFDVTVENRGTASAQNIQIEAFNGKIGDPGRRLTNQVMLPPTVIARLDPGEKATRRMRWDPWDNAGEHTLFFVVDPRFQIEESSERNNVATLPLRVRGKADLVLSGRIVPATDGEGYLLAIVVRNEGESTARVEEGELLVLLRYLGTQGPLKAIELASLAPLHAGEERPLPPVPIPAYASGRFGEGEVVALEVEVDPVGIANEVTHKNNRVRVDLPQQRSTLRAGSGHGAAQRPE